MCVCVVCVKGGVGVCVSDWDMKCRSTQSHTHTHIHAQITHLFRILNCSSFPLVFCKAVPNILMICTVLQHHAHHCCDATANSATHFLNLNFVKQSVSASLRKCVCVCVCASCASVRVQTTQQTYKVGS